MTESGLRLSVIIVNYNVRHFLEQALLSVQRAMEDVKGDIWVVDNNSADASAEMVREKFPGVHLIENKENTGFSVANNQAIRVSQGEYVLLLNPDTLVEEDTFTKCLAFMDAHPDAGALGVKMLDGSGKFLPESKRGFPSPWVSFCKTVGLSALLPQSAVFNGYYLGHLSPDETHQIDVLSGAFMWLRRSALDRSGLLDEAFFMYGEDIDLSYRIKQAGYDNYYFPETKIIHYKGESTKKGSLNYVKTFYQAMIIFAGKHFTGRRAGLFVLMLQVAIWLRAGLTLFANVLRRWRLPFADAVLIFAGLFFLKDFWANYFYHDPGYFKPALVTFNFPLYIFVWVLTLWLHGGYDEKYDLRRLARGLGLGTILLAAIYGFLDLEYRPSRALILLGALWAAGALTGLRLLLYFREYRNLRIGRERIKNLMIVGSKDESERVLGLLNQAGVRKKLVHTSPNTERMDEMVRIFKVEEIIFCSKDIQSRDILTWMTRLGPYISYKIVPEESLSIIGSSSKDEPGELYTIDIRYAIAQPRQQRSKRVLDLGICMALVLSFPLWAIASRHRKRYLKGWWLVASGQYSWVGYIPHHGNRALPRIKPGIFTPLENLHDMVPGSEIVERLNFLYARDWAEWNDLELLF
jgi:GT2 family glycosyltransferase